MSENSLVELPSTIGRMQALRTMHIQNNKLTSLPPEMGDMEGLEDLICTGNELAEVPESLREQAKLVVWLCGKEKRKRPGETAGRDGRERRDAAEKLRVVDIDCVMGARVERGGRLGEGEVGRIFGRRRTLCIHPFTCGMRSA